MKITLAKSLNLKNRLAEKLNKVSQQIQENNSVMIGKIRQISVEESLEKRTKLQQALVDLKTAIYQANQGIQTLIFANAERKVTITFLNGVKTVSGMQETDIRWGQEQKAVEYTAIISYKQVQKSITELEAEIDKTQDRIDEYNHRIEIEVSDLIFELLQ